MPDRHNRRQSRDRDQREEPRLDPSAVKLSLNAQGTIDPELFDGIAKRMAEAIAANQRRNKPSQLRRFYDELCLWETRVSQQPEKFAQYLPLIRMLNAKAAYANGRGLVDDNFVRLLHHTLAQVDDHAALNRCKLFWEAFLGFYKEKHPE